MPSESLAFAFDGKNLNAQRMAQLHSLRKIKGVTKETKTALRKIVTRSIAEGIPPYDAARLIKPMIGLTAPQQTAVFNFRTNLINSGLSIAAVDRKTARYIQKSLRVRAKMIARTEIIGSLALGQQAAWGQAQKAGMIGSNAQKRWITTGFGACPICTQLSGMTVPISGSFQSIVGPLDRPTAHPNCRCAVVPVPAPGVPGAAPSVAPTPTPTPTLTPTPKVKVKAKRPLSGPQIRQKIRDDKRWRGDVGEADYLPGSLRKVNELSAQVRYLRNEITVKLKRGGRKKEVDALIKEYDQVKKQLDALRVTDQLSARQAIHDMVLTDTRSEFTVFTHQRGTVVSSKNVHQAGQDLRKGIHSGSLRELEGVAARDADGIEFIRRLLGEDLADKWKVTINNTGTDLYRGRSNYNPIRNYDQGGTINLSIRGRMQGRKTVVHEMGHWIEERTGWDRESWKWVLKRRKPGEKIQRLKDMYPDRGFDDTEWAFEDLFRERGLSSYIGKRYNRASEVLSMGLEAFYENPLKLMNQDKDFFDFIIRSINEIRGGYTHTGPAARKLKFGGPIGPTE